MASSSVISPNALKVIKTVDRLTIFVTRHWLALFILFYGAYVLMPFTAPILMQLGAVSAAQDLYFFYSFFCHQLPERSLFFFGEKLMYSYAEIGRVWSTQDALTLRRFIGTPEMGWKMAWSDRMISTYGGIWLATLVYALLGKRAPRVSLAVWLVLGVLPLGLDGATHMLNDLVAGTSGAGFRDTNDWLRALTANTLPDSFYVGDEFGSFNSWMRWISGLLFSFTTVLAIVPLIGDSMRNIEGDMAHQLERVHLRERGIG